MKKIKAFFDNKSNKGGGSEGDEASKEGKENQLVQVNKAIMIDFRMNS